MNRDVAEQLQLMALTVEARMRETLDYAGDHCSPEEFVRIGQTTGRVLSALIDGILEPIQAEHSDLVPQGMRGPYVIDPAKLGPALYQRDAASIERDSREDADMTDEQKRVVATLSAADIESIDTELMSQITVRRLKLARVIGQTMLAFHDGRFKGVPDVFFAERVRELERRGLIESFGNTKRMRFSEVRRVER